MRTVGTLQDVYRAAKAYYEGMAGKPIDAVVLRYEDGVWVLESGLTPGSGVEAEISCPLEAFDSWFYEGYKNDNYLPSENDEREFIEAMKEG